MPLHGQSDRRVQAFRTEVNMLLGETLIMATPPKPQVGRGAAGGGEGLVDMGHLEVVPQQSTTYD